MEWHFHDDVSCLKDSLVKSDRLWGLATFTIQVVWRRSHCLCSINAASVASRLQRTLDLLSYTARSNWQMKRHLNGPVRSLMKAASANNVSVYKHRKSINWNSGWFVKLIFLNVTIHHAYGTVYLLQMSVMKSDASQYDVSNICYDFSKSCWRLTRPHKQRSVNHPIV